MEIRSSCSGWIPAIFNGAEGGLLRQFGRRSILVGDMAFLDPGPGGDPFVRGIDDFSQGRCSSKSDPAYRILFQ